MTPVAEFNTYADTIAAARVYALTSPNPHTTMPPVPPAPPGTPEGTYPPPFLNPYPPNLPNRLKLSLFPLDITEQHLLTRGAFRALLSPLTTAHSPLAEWTQAFMNATFAKVESLHPVVTGDAVSLQLHDPMCTWYCMTANHAGWKFAVDEDLRVETAGQWTRGMCVVDRRDRPKSDDADLHEVRSSCLPLLLLWNEHGANLIDCIGRGRYRWMARRRQRQQTTDMHRLAWPSGLWRVHGEEDFWPVSDGESILHLLCYI